MPPPTKLKATKKANIFKYTFLLIAGLLCFLVFKNVTAPESTAEIAQGKWEKLKVGNTPALEFLSPVKLEEASSPLDEDIAQMLNDFKTFTFNEGENLSIKVNMVDYKDSSKLDLEGAASGWTNELSNEYEGFKFTHQPVQISGRKGVKEEGTFLNQKKSFAFANVFVKHANKIWQVTVIHLEGDRNGAFIKNRIIESLALL